MKKNKKQIFCKNFFLFLLLLKYNQTKNGFYKSSIFIKPYTKKILTLLRSPYRHKLTRHQMVLNRYHIASSIRLKTNIPFLKNFKSIISIFKKINEINFWFESNIISNHRFKFSFNFKYKNNFFIKNFSINNKLKNKNK